VGFQELPTGTTTHNRQSIEAIGIDPMRWPGKLIRPRQPLLVFAVADCEKKLEDDREHLPAKILA
jgi:hypothetical protein